MEVIAGSENKKRSRDGTPLESTFNCPWGITFDQKTNTCFVTDCNNHKIRVIK